MSKKKTTFAYKIVKGLIFACYPRFEVVGAEHIPDEPVIIVGNHTQMHGPLCCEFYSPVERYTWCAGEMMHWDEVSGYAFQDFWSQKPKWTHGFYRILSYLIAPLAVCIFNNANTIAVYHDGRAISAFKHSVQKLQEGASVVVFPEKDEKFNHILYEFQDKFIDVARLYHKKTGKEVAFVPLYIAPALKKMVYGEPIRFCADRPIDEERGRICDELKDSITRLALDLPRHRVVPYRNIPKKDYPYNK